LASQSIGSAGALEKKELLPMLEVQNLRRTALVLVVTTLLWNLLEAVVSIWTGLVAGSVSLLAYGFDGVIELLVGGVMVWRLLATGDEDQEEAAERRARKLIGLTFFFLAAYVTLHALGSLFGVLPQPGPSLVGIVLVVASAVVMTGFYVAKIRIAIRIQSRALRAEALQTLFCDLQDAAILVGLGLNLLFAWWWADSTAALLLVPLLVKEGAENLSGDDCAGDEGAFRVCSCPNCFFGLRRCNCAVCAA